MKTFSSFKGFGDELLRIASRESKILEVGLTTAAKVIQRKAKSEIGHLQSEAGPFPAWEELAESTKADKEKKGFVFNEQYNPLLRTGHLRDSIVIEIKVPTMALGEAIIGSKEEIMAYQEYGTKNIPPRPVIGRAAYVSKEKIKTALGLSMVMNLKGKEVSVQTFGKYVYEGIEE